MAKRNEEFYNEEYYHIFNRGVDKRKIFMDKGDLYYFFDAMKISNQKNIIKDRHSLKRKYIKQDIEDVNNLVSIVSYCLLPNHFHFILKQEIEGGISKFMQKLGNSYGKYFNAKYERSGALFEGRFKANKITGEMSRELTSVYVNLNYKHHNYDIKKELIKSSIFEYLEEEKGEKICNPKEIKNIINTIGSVNSYKEYSKNQSKYFSEKHDNSDELNFNEFEK